MPGKYKNSLSLAPFPYMFNGSWLIFKKTSTYALELSHNLVVNSLSGQRKVLGKLSGEDRQHLEMHRKMSFGGNWIFDDKLITEMDMCPLTPEDHAWALEHNLGFDNTVFVDAAFITPTAITTPSAPETVHIAVPLASDPEVKVQQVSEPFLSPSLSPLTPNQVKLDPVPTSTLTSAQVEAQRMLETTFKYHTELFPGMSAPALLNSIQAAITQYLTHRAPE